MSAVQIRQRPINQLFVVATLCSCYAVRSMEKEKETPGRQRGQGFRATRRLADTPLERNMVVRCSDELYQAARSAAGKRSVTLSDYVRELIIQDVQQSTSAGRAS